MCDLPPPYMHGGLVMRNQQVATVVLNGAAVVVSFMFKPTLSTTGGSKIETGPLENQAGTSLFLCFFVVSRGTKPRSRKQPVRGKAFYPSALIPPFEDSCMSTWSHPSSIVPSSLFNVQATFCCSNRRRWFLSREMWPIQVSSARISHPTRRFRSPFTHKPSLVRRIHWCVCVHRNICEAIKRFMHIAEGINGFFVLDTVTYARWYPSSFWEPTKAVHRLYVQF